MHLGVTLNETITEICALKNFEPIVRNYVTDSLSAKSLGNVQSWTKGGRQINKIKQNWFFYGTVYS